MKFLSSIKEIYNSYDYFIFDVWGVIHDGNKPYPDVLETISFLHNQGKKVCFLSNAPRRASKVVEVLKKYGISENLYDFILTSGEATFLDLKKNQEEGFKTFGKNYFYIGPTKDLDLLDDLDYVRVESAAEADFALSTGFDGEDSTLEEKLPQAHEAKKYNLPMICVNPDLIVVRQSGHEMICAGALAKEYEKIGGKVFYYGKPFSSVYKMICEIFGSNQTEKMLAIGDGLETDIKGANDTGVHSLLVTGGILSNKLEVKFWENPNEEKLKEICDFHEIFPKFVISHLK